MSNTSENLFGCKEMTKNQVLLVRARNASAARQKIISKIISPSLTQAPIFQIEKGIADFVERCVKRLTVTAWLQEKPDSLVNMICELDVLSSDKGLVQYSFPRRWYGEILAGNWEEPKYALLIDALYLAALKESQ